MADIEEIVRSYMAAWNETDEAKRRGLLETAWAEGGTYTDPQSDVAGREALVGLIGGMHAQMPGARIDLASKVEVHHDKLRFNWKFVSGATVIEGVDYGEVAPDGRLSKIVGFWGSPPALG